MTEADAIRLWQFIGGFGLLVYLLWCYSYYETSTIVSEWFEYQYMPATQEFKMRYRAKYGRSYE